MNSNFNWHKLLKVLLFGLLAVVAVLYIVLPLLNNVGMRVGDLLIAAIGKYPLGMALIVGSLAYIAYCINSHSKPDTPAPLPPPPTMEDYFTVLNTIRPAVAEVASVLGLAPVYSHTDMAVDSVERILRWGRVWGLCYKALKLPGTTDFDVEKAARILQAQVKTVLERDNPSRLAATKFNYCGSFEPIIQIAEVKDGEAYIHIFAVIASEDYFKQKANEERLHNQSIKTDADDADF